MISQTVESSYNYYISEIPVRCTTFFEKKIIEKTLDRKQIGAWSILISCSFALVTFVLYVELGEDYNLTTIPQEKKEIAAVFPDFFFEKTIKKSLN